MTTLFASPFHIERHNRFRLYPIGLSSIGLPLRSQRLGENIILGDIYYLRQTARNPSNQIKLFAGAPSLYSEIWLCLAGNNALQGG